MKSQDGRFTTSFYPMRWIKSLPSGCRGWSRSRGVKLNVIIKPMRLLRSSTTTSNCGWHARRQRLARTLCRGVGRPGDGVRPHRPGRMRLYGRPRHNFQVRRMPLLHACSHPAHAVITRALHTELPPPSPSRRTRPRPCHIRLPSSLLGALGGDASTVGATGVPTM